MPHARGPRTIHTWPRSISGMGSLDLAGACRHRPTSHERGNHVNACRAITASDPGLSGQNAHSHQLLEQVGVHCARLDLLGNVRPTVGLRHCGGVRMAESGFCQNRCLSQQGPQLRAMPPAVVERRGGAQRTSWYMPSVRRGVEAARLLSAAAAWLRRRPRRCRPCLPAAPLCPARRSPSLVQCRRQRTERQR